MLEIISVRRHRQFDITSQCQPPGAVRSVNQSQPPYFHIIIRGYDDFGFALNAFIFSPELGMSNVKLNSIDQPCRQPDDNCCSTNGSIQYRGYSRMTPMRHGSSPVSSV